MDKEIPDDFTIHSSKKEFQMTLKMFGRSPGDDVDDFNFIAYMAGSSQLTKKEMDQHRWFYVGTYNTRTRKGKCLEIGVVEFFKSSINRLLFPNYI